MRIAFVELQNFRKLRSVRIDFDRQATLCVGANNSGKTSAMLALGHFLVDPSRFTPNDFTLSHWATLNALGRRWEGMDPWQLDEPLSSPFWHDVLPSLDLWLEVPANQLHLAQAMIPSLGWQHGKLGVRLRFEPVDVEALAKEYLAARKEVRDTIAAAAIPGQPPPTVTLWPEHMRSFLDRRIDKHFTIRFYLLDPARCLDPDLGVARPQAIPAESQPLPVDPLKGLLRVDEIGAQRGLGEWTGEHGDEATPKESAGREKKRLSEQLRKYYSRHLDPTQYPDAADLEALAAIESAQHTYNTKLRAGFSKSIGELQSLNYPGVTDPRLQIATRLRPSDGLNHSAAVQYDIAATASTNGLSDMSLPEEYNGLGYQNLILMVFKLMSFRDAWMRVGKFGKAATAAGKDSNPPPLHIVLIEEPEAYLHAQVQQVFVRKAYDVLRNHETLKIDGSQQAHKIDNPALSTQLVVSTHSNHIAHECEFACLRYFRRMPATAANGVPTATVINLSSVFGVDDETRKFVKRYLRATHCDLFFADAAILVEGTAEHVLIPHFISHRYRPLHCCYITLLEINGSHAHRLRPLIEALGLLTLIVSDLDSGEAEGKHKIVAPCRGVGQVTRNSTVKSWHPVQTSIDALLDIAAVNKVKTYAMPLFAVRVAYQCPMQVVLVADAAPSEVLARTFEDALIIENLDLFRSLPVDTDIGGVTAEDVSSNDPATLAQQVFNKVNNLDKAAFALDLLLHKDPAEIKPPTYIAEGLEWLQGQLTERHATTVMPTAAPSAVTEAVAAATSGGAA